ncbi:MAG: zinc ribbon domain-containing protein [Symbiobacteriaceae bacterium]|nr:zinc ribbon domain-containing protein [Symbiobacteriaceae bacterium]
MKYCSNCGQEMPNSAVYCVRCGTTAPYEASAMAVAYDDYPSGGLKAVSFLIPLVGLILFIMNYHSKPESATAYGKFALVGFITSWVIVGLFYGSLISMLLW